MYGVVAKDNELIYGTVLELAEKVYCSKSTMQQAMMDDANSVVGYRFKYLGRISNQYVLYKDGTRLARGTIKELAKIINQSRGNVYRLVLNPNKEKSSYAVNWDGFEVIKNGKVTYIGK